jgi:hypothetical protein
MKGENLKFVPSNTELTVHIVKDGFKMLCGYTSRNIPCSNGARQDKYPNYKVCSKCYDKLSL